MTGPAQTLPPGVEQGNRIKSFLKASTFLGCLPDDALAQLIKRGNVVRYKKGAVIYERGDDGDSLIAILAGRVKIHIITVDAREVVLNFLGPGELNGEISTLDGRGRTASAMALEPTEAFQVYRRDLLPVLKQYPDALIEIMQILCDKLRSTSEIVEDNQRTLPGRAAKGLLRLARNHGRRTKDEVVIDLIVSQRDLGNYIGMSRENTNRQIAAFCEHGILTSTSGKIVIHDESALIAIAESEDA